MEPFAQHALTDTTLAPTACAFQSTRFATHTTHLVHASVATQATLSVEPSALCLTSNQTPTAKAILPVDHALLATVVFI